MPLSFVEPTAAPTTVNVLLYGPPGAGKTVAACSAPGPILVINAEGPGALRFARRLHGNDKLREVAFQGKQTLTDAYLYARDPANGVATVVVDSLGEVYRVLLEELGGQRPTLQQYGDVNILVERFVRSMRDLPVHLVLVAHEQVDDVDGEAVRRPATGGRKLPETIAAMMDVVAHTGVVLETDSEPRRWVGQLVEAKGRRCKDRSGVLGLIRDLDLSDWIEAINQADGVKPAAKTRKAA